MYPARYPFGDYAPSALWHFCKEKVEVVVQWSIEVYTIVMGEPCVVCMCVLPFPVFVIGGLLPPSSPPLYECEKEVVLDAAFLFPALSVRFLYVIFFLLSRYLHCNCRPLRVSLILLGFSSSFFIKYIHKQTLQLFSFDAYTYLQLH